MPLVNLLKSAAGTCPLLRPEGRHPLPRTLRMPPDLPAGWNEMVRLATVPKDDVFGGFQHEAGVLPFRDAGPFQLPGGQILGFADGDHQMLVTGPDYDGFHVCFLHGRQIVHMVWQRDVDLN